MSSQSIIPRPRVIATLGPRSFDLAKVLVEAGATELRLNASHLSPAEVREHSMRLRAELATIPCVIDLQGKKMRVGVFEPRQLDVGTRVDLTCDPNQTRSIFVPHPELFEQSAIGEYLSLDDGRIEVEVIGREPGSLATLVCRSGILQSRKGINRSLHPIELSDLSALDQQTISNCRDLAGIAFAMSFASDGVEASWIRRRAPKCRVILKVERREALNNLPELARQADELWICRGDLAAQLGLSAMARAVANLQPRNHCIPILMAGQVLQHLCQHEAPTRSEVCHLHDLLVRGYSGIVLSDETAIGVSPVSATRWAAQLVESIESLP